MDKFGDLRSAVHSHDYRGVVKAAAKVKTMPGKEVVAYIRESWGWVPVDRWWIGLSDAQRLSDLSFVHGTNMFGYLSVDGGEIEVAFCDEPYKAINKALLPIRERVLDESWGDTIDQKLAWLLREHLAMVSMGDNQDKISRSMSRISSAWSKEKERNVVSAVIGTYLPEVISRCANILGDGVHDELNTRMLEDGELWRNSLRRAEQRQGDSSG